MGLSLVVFAVMWTLMMMAMMLPSPMPMITLYSRTIRSRRGLRMTQFGLGHLIVYGLAGLPAFAVAWLAGRKATERPGWSTAAAALFVVAGAYQLTPLKHSCPR